MVAMASQAPNLGSDNLLHRFGPLVTGWDLLGKFKLDTFAKQIVGPVLTTGQARDRLGNPIAEGINFGSQDYLSLASHPQVMAAAHAAIEAYGVHSAGSPALMGNIKPAANTVDTNPGLSNNKPARMKRMGHINW